MKIEWILRAEWSVAFLSGLSEFASLVNFSYGDQKVYRITGNASEVTFLGGHLKRTLFLIPLPAKKRRLFSRLPSNPLKIKSIVITGFVGYFHSRFTEKGSNTTYSVLDDDKMNQFLQGEIPKRTNRNLLLQSTTNHIQIGSSISWQLGNFNVEYHFFYNIGFRTFFRKEIEYQYFQRLFQQASLQFEGSGFGGTFGMRYNFNL